MRHPWMEFLIARANVIDWLREQWNYNDEYIANHLSMDEEQVYLIRTRNRENDFIKIGNEE